MVVEWLRHARQPLVIGLLCALAVNAVVDAKELLFQPMCLLEQGESANPRFVQKHLHGFKVRVTFQEQVPVLLETSILVRSQGSLERLPVILHAEVGQANDVELIDDDRHVRENDLAGPAVRSPHIHGYDLQGAMVIKAGQPLYHGVLVAVWQEIENRSISDVGEDAPRPAHSEDLIDTQDLWGDGLVEIIDHLGVSLKDVPDRLGINADLLSDIGVGSPGALIQDVVHGPLSQAMITVQEISRLQKGLAAVSALVPLPDDVENHALTQSGQVVVDGLPGAKFAQLKKMALRASSHQRLVLQGYPDRAAAFLGELYIPSERIEKFQDGRIAE